MDENDIVCPQCGSDLDMGLVDKDYMKDDQYHTFIAIRRLRCYKCPQCDAVIYNERTKQFLQTITNVVVKYNRDMDELENQ